MSMYCKLIFFVFYITVSQQSVYNDIKDNILSFLVTGGKDRQEKGSKILRIDYKFSHNNGNHPSRYNEIKENVLPLIQRYIDDSKFKDRQEKKPSVAIPNFIDDISKEFREFRGNKRISSDFRFSTTKRDPKSKSNYLRMYPVLNSLRNSLRRKGEKSSSSISSSSSSLELKDWKDEWREHWLHKKLEAINVSRPNGDVVNMVAARPWGVRCGDPNQHDMPWGTCMLPMECEAEYRIYRGDHFCGRTQYVCCALELTTYDMYQGFDVSFADSSLLTDSEERRDRYRGLSEKRGGDKKKEHRKRRKERMRRKRKIKKNIRKIIKEIRKTLNRSYKNETTQRKLKTKQLKKFIKDLKKQYRNDRQSVKDIHETEMTKIDAALQKKLNEIGSMNTDFLKNSTFRDIIVNGTINKQGARMLLQAYPELSSYLDTRRTGDLDYPKDYLEYDIEYGLLYH